MIPEFSITPAQISDLDTLNEMMFDLHQEHHVKEPELFKTPEDIEQEKSIARYFDNPECLVYKAVMKKKIVGFITGHFCELISTVSKPMMMGSIDELYVAPSFRKMGIAKDLIRKIESTFIDYGVKQTFVEVWHFNQTAVSFYREHGFVHHIHWLRKPV
ncbi:GNAT family N-acetyltransferase [Vibrio sagamiensis]|uniref:N-acetyltransferase n=1 Tax=Vibrio sagamiensis NBRC 104589 TaxID=1219064 RepID=A0A511QE64_9VIBR|nr:N-acetyltransferase [Vibrio sagamiensis]PNQ53580.1 N-acetyltransferase [Vibrio agarivorans]GEM75476.1 N-acetyltransferase [Vibrio sagamiensis NBRC 104589]